MNWKQTGSKQWIRDDGLTLDIEPYTQTGMKRQTIFWLSSIFNTKAKVDLITTYSAKERDDLLKFILRDYRTIIFFGTGDWERAIANLNLARRNYKDFEEIFRGSYYGIKYVKYEE
jgi:hypothetical protein